MPIKPTDQRLQDYSCPACGRTLATGSGGVLTPAVSVQLRQETHLAPSLHCPCGHVLVLLTVSLWHGGGHEGSADTLY